MSMKILLKLSVNFCRKYSQSTNKSLICEHLRGPHTGITVFGLNRPEQKNAMSMQLLENLTKGINKIPFENNTKLLIIRSMVPEVFCAGIYSILKHFFN